MHDVSRMLKSVYRRKVVSQRQESNSKEVECSKKVSMVGGKQKLSILSLLDQDLGRGSSELVAPVETRNLQNEEITDNVTLELLDKITSSLGGTA